MADEYFIRMRGRVQGPYSLEKLQAMARRGQVSRFHELSSNQQQWTKAADLKELFETNARQAVELKLNGNRDNAYDIEPAAVETSSHQWFYGDGNEQKGPVDTLTLHRLIQSGSLGPEDEVWCEGMANWAPIGEVPRLVIYLPAGSRTSSGGAGSYFRGLLGAKRMAVASCAALLVMLGGFGLLYYGVFSRFDSDVITSIAQHEKFDDAVGKVVWGWDVLLIDGKHLQVPISMGTAFTISQKGFMITNRHVVETFERMQKATVDVNKREFSEKLAEYDVVKNLKPEEEIKLDELRKRVERSRDKFASTINKINPVLFVFLHGEKYEATLTFVWPTYDCAIIHSDHGKQTRFRLSGVSAERLLDKEVRAIGFPQISTVEFSDAEKVSRQAVKDISGDLKTMFDGRDLQYFFPSGRISQVTRELPSDLMWLQHTAELAHGMSGGPLMGMDAIVLGVNTQYVGQSEGATEKVNRSFTLYGPLKKEINKYVPDVIWVE